MYYLRALLIVVLVLSGYYIGSMEEEPYKGVAVGLIVGLLANVFEHFFRRATFGGIVGGIIGIALGLLSAKLFLVPFADAMGDIYPFAYFVIGSVFGYGGLLLGIAKCKDLTLPAVVRLIKGQGENENIKLLDTSVIIDGRIADICETGFIEGIFVVPQFILHELQHIADSPDSLKRARGRRGLDILNRMQKIQQITVRIVEDDFPKIREVDSKLVALAKVMDAKVMTNDFNLNKVAELQGVIVLNINQLANAIKPLVLPGEPLRVFIIKEGKEANQGVAYLEDGTMVVVDNGRKYIGNNLDVTVTSVLQTTAGRMIFTKSREEYERDDRSR